MMILGVYGSPRKDGNTDLLLNQFLKGASTNGHKIKKVHVRKLNISPCLACGECEETGKCTISDDMDIVYEALLNTECLVLASPIYFYSVTAQVKILIDRCHVLWYKRRVSNNNGFRPAFFISVAGTKGKRVFDGAMLTIKCFFYAIGFRLKNHWLYSGFDAKGEIEKYPEVLSKIYNAGKTLC
jgi:multimeric flavodoxin WrbA